MTDAPQFSTNDVVTALLRGRRSIDLFRPEPVSTGVLIEAIEAARWAPNHRLTEPWRFYLIGPATAGAIIELAAEIDAAKKGEAAGAARRARLQGIPGFFVLTSQRSEDSLRDREDYAACCCAAQNLMLYLWQRGIGVKWTTGGVTRHARFYEILEIDAGKEAVVGFFWYGLPKVVPTQQRKPVPEIVTERP
ncbi:MAG TPA: nitroreductase [Gammaproteobacteria bacterium]|nr:nitroreductase [Gammaproteobacteria bacterium]